MRIVTLSLQVPRDTLLGCLVLGISLQSKRKGSQMVYQLSKHRNYKYPIQNITLRFIYTDKVMYANYWIGVMEQDGQVPHRPVDHFR